MKELGEINREDYHSTVYPHQVVKGELVGQFTLNGEIVLYANPENPPIRQIPQESKPQREFNPYQGCFQLSTGINLPPLKLK